jgi:D-alanyl-D-alanine carboxypeptidase
MRRLFLAIVTILTCACSSSTGGTPGGDPTPAAIPPVDPPAPERDPACVDQDTKLQAALDGARKSPNAVLAVRNAACGTSVYVSGDPKNADTGSLWRIGSITKTFTSTVIMSLVAEGKISLDDPLSKYVADVKGTDGVTVRMLLNHTSGIFNYTESKAFDQSKKYAPADLVALATANAAYFAPGQGWHYSNTNYILLGMIGEKAGGAKIGALVRARAIAKAGLEHTFFDGEEALGGTLAKGFDSAGDDVTTAVDPSGPWSAGAIAASGADLADWVFTLYGTDEVLDAPTRALLTKDAYTSLDTGTYGLGVIVMSSQETGGRGTALGHDGAIAGYFSQAFYFTTKNASIAAVVNADGASPNDITLAAMTVLFPK